MKKVIWGFRIGAVGVLLVGGALWFLGPRGEGGEPNPWVMRSIAAFLVLYMIASAINVGRQFFALKRSPLDLPRTSTRLTHPSPGAEPRDPPPQP